jgi:hypothetical protein
MLPIDKKLPHLPIPNIPLPKLSNENFTIQLEEKLLNYPNETFSPKTVNFINDFLD